jgi:hypothetical protein
LTRTIFSIGVEKVKNGRKKKRRATKERVIHLREQMCQTAEYVFAHRIFFVHVLAKVSIELMAIYFHSYEIFIIQFGDFSIVESNYFQNAQKRQRFLDDFEALVRKIDVPG